jgi:lipoate---protein ligase
VTAPEVWRRLGPAVLAPEAAVARPPALLAAMPPGGPPVASWSRVARTALVLGRAAADPPLHGAALARRAIPVLRRRSGGGPVLWDPALVSLDVVVPAGHRLAGRDVTLSYRWLGAVVADALRTLGVGARVVPLDEARSAAGGGDPVARRAARACFGGLSPFEVLAPDGRKLVGLSQVRRRAGALFQCGIALDFDATLLAEVLEPDAHERGRLAAALAARATGVHAFAPDVLPGDVVRAVDAALAAREGVRLRPSALVAAERAPGGGAPPGAPAPREQDGV